MTGRRRYSRAARACVHASGAAGGTDRPHRGSAGAQHADAAKLARAGAHTPPRRRARAAARLARQLDTLLSRASAYPHPAGRIVRIETHISVVYLAGRYAYKRMKPFDFGFADFSRVAERRRACDAEPRLNAPLARGLYLDVWPIAARERGNGSRRGFALRARRGARDGAGGFADGADVADAADSDGNVDYVVRMRRFDDRLLFSALAARGQLTADDVERAAARLAEAHLSAPRRIPRREYGTAAMLRTRLDGVLVPLRRTFGDAFPEPLAAWCGERCDMLAPFIDARRAAGRVRGCHGDLHLDNLVRAGSDVQMFDCIDFDDALRWIDVQNDLAFLLMDLRAHGRADLAQRALNRWLDVTGDFGGLEALPLYIAYRALVRALVATMRGRDARSRTAARGDASRYLRVAADAAGMTNVIGAAMRARPALLLCHGYSGSGKSVASPPLAALAGAVRISSDTERKRARPFSLAIEHALPASAYARDAIDAQYAHLLAIARDVLRAGFTALVDATFVASRHRGAFVALARELGIPVFIVDFRADRAVLAARVRERTRIGHDRSDAGEAVLDLQRASADPLAADELAFTVAFDTDVPLARFETPVYWQPLFARLAHAGAMLPPQQAAERA